MEDTKKLYDIIDLLNYQMQQLALEIRRLNAPTQCAVIRDYETVQRCKTRAKDKLLQIIKTKIRYSGAYCHLVNSDSKKLNCPYENKLQNFCDLLVRGKGINLRCTDCKDLMGEEPIVEPTDPGVNEKPSSTQDNTRGL